MFLQKDCCSNALQYVQRRDCAFILILVTHLVLFSNEIDFVAKDGRAELMMVIHRLVKSTKLFILTIVILTG